MIDEERPRVPPPVVAAALIYPMATALQMVHLLTSGSAKASGLKAALFALGLFGLSLALAYGLRRRVWRAWTATMVFSAGNIAYTVTGVFGSGPSAVLRVLGFAAVIGLLLVPASSRAWFPNGRPPA